MNPIVTFLTKTIVTGYLVFCSFLLIVKHSVVIRIQGYIINFDKNV